MTSSEVQNQSQPLIKTGLDQDRSSPESVKKHGGNEYRTKQNEESKSLDRGDYGAHQSNNYQSQGFISGNSMDHFVTASQGIELVK